MKTTISPTKRVLKSMVGRPGDFLGFDGNVYNGRLESCRKGWVEFLYYVPGKGEFKTVLKSTEKRLEMY